MKYFAFILFSFFFLVASIVEAQEEALGQFQINVKNNTYTVTSYIDLDFAVHGPMTAYYKVVAINGGRESEFTETLDISVGLYKTGIDNKLFSYKLLQNYPNPFNPSTSIEFSIKNDAFVSLKVYDLLGRKVATIVNEFLNSGTYKIHFDGSNLESGIYFYEISAGDFRDMKKFILIK